MQQIRSSDFLDFKHQTRLLGIFISGPHQSNFSPTRTEKIKTSVKCLERVGLLKIIKWKRETWLPEIKFTKQKNVLSFWNTTIYKI